MITILREVQIPFILIGIIIGYQTAIYFFYQYLHYRKENLKMNKILIAYGLFFLFGLSGILLRNINLYFILDLGLINLLFKITNLLMVLTILLFILTISSTSFTDIINPIISKIFAIITFISLPPIFVYEHNSIELYLFTIPALIGILYIWYFQIKLIKKAEKNIRWRLILILIGMVILLSGFVARGEFFRAFILQENEPYIINITSIGSIIMLFLIFLGIYQFPAFLELNWKDDLIQFLIINHQSKSCIYSLVFPRSEKIKGKLDEENSRSFNNSLLFSKGLIGIDEIINLITNQTEKKTSSIRHGKLHFMFLYGDLSYSFLAFILIIRQENLNVQYYLKRLKENFQELYAEILEDLEKFEGIENELFINFNSIAFNLLEIKQEE